MANTDRKRVVVVCKSCGEGRYVSVTKNKELIAAQERDCPKCARSKMKMPPRPKRVRANVKCPQCGLVRPLQVRPGEPYSDRLCKSCADTNSGAKDPAVSLYKAPCGMTIVPLSESRCEAGDDCESYWECLNFAARQNWQGWRVIAA